LLAALAAFIGFNEFGFKHKSFFMAARKVMGEVVGLALNLSWSLLSLPPPSLPQNPGLGAAWSGCHWNILTDLW